MRKECPPQTPNRAVSIFNAQRPQRHLKYSSLHHIRRVRLAHSGMVRLLRERNTLRITRIMRRRSIVGWWLEMPIIILILLHRPGDLDRKAASEPLCCSLQSVLSLWLRRICWWVLFALYTQLERSLAACSADHLVFGGGTIDSDLAGADAWFAVAEDEGLQ